MERTLLEAAIRAPRLDVARALLNERLGVRESSTYTWSKYAEALIGIGDESGASVAANRARVLADEILAAAKALTVTE
jgi:outer membrane PBP1 activator LpoA protein